jgi:cobalamin biosynthesis Mg chelatase CobN
VSYPKDFCGVLQADAIVGPSPWLLEYGHQKMIKTKKSCDPHTTTTTMASTTTTTTTTKPQNTTTTTTKPRTTTTTTKPKSHHHHHAATTTTTTTAQLPFTSSTSPAAVAAAAAVVRSATTTSDPVTTQLPFTGADVRPLAIVGTLLIIFGLYILTTLEQRRRVLRRMSYSMRSGSAAGFRIRTTRWFLGE